MPDKKGAELESFIELNRQFRKLKQKAKAEEAAFESYTSDLLWGGNKAFSWDSLLNEYRVVILGEAASGKSWEFVSRVKTLKRNGETAFFKERNKMILWLAVWMQIDGMAAITYLQTSLNGSQNAKEIVEGLCSLLFGDGMQRAPIVRNPSYLEPNCLRHFIPMVYHHVKPGDDIDRSSGGAYSPTARDHAQRFRGVMLDHLAKSDVAEAADYLRDLTNEPSMITFDEVIAVVKQCALSSMKTNLKIYGLEVIGINFSEPAGNKRKSQIKR